MPHCGCAMLLPSFKNPHRRQISANGNGFRVVRQIGHFRQHRTIPALRLKHRSGSCGTASALPKCSIMSGCGTCIVLRGQKPLALCDRCPCFGSLFPPLAALTFAASSIICAFWLSICRTSLAVSALRIMRYCPYSINSIIMLCAFCACSPIRQALSPAQNRSLPSPQSGQTNRPHKQSAGFSGQAGQCPGALIRSSA